MAKTNSSSRTKGKQVTPRSARTRGIDILKFDTVLTLDDGERTLPIKLDEDTMQKARDYTALLISARGIKIEISGRDQEAGLMARRKMKVQKSRRLERSDIANITAGIQNMHTPHETAARYSAVLLALLDSTDVLFAVGEKADGSITVETLPPFDDLEIPENYFRPRVKTELRKLLEKTAYAPTEPEVDPNHPVEIMLAYASDLLDKNPDMNQQLQQHVETAYFGMQWGDVLLDEEQERLFRDALASVLFETVVNGDSDDQREVSGERVSEPDEPTGNAE